MDRFKADLQRIFFITLGTFLVALATNGVLVHNHLLSGGVSGISIFLHFIFDLDISRMIIILNIPLFIIGFFFLKKHFLLYSLYGMSMLSFWIGLTDHFVIPTSETVTMLLVGGVLHGLGTGIIFRGDGSTGGMDIVAKIINRYFSINMATVNLIINGTIILLSILFFGIDLSVLTLATMFISSKVTYFVVDGINYKRTLSIITDESHYEMILKSITKEIHRGVTFVEATGAYTFEKKYILYTTVGMREVAKVRYLVFQIDPNAFMTVSETAQVIGHGRGFMPTEEEG